MKKTISILSLLCIVVLNSGCVVLAGYGIYKVARKASSQAPKISEEEKLRLEYNEIQGSKEGVFKSVEKVLTDWGYKIISSDYLEGVIVSTEEDRGMNIKVTVTVVKENMVGLRINITEKNVMVENQRLYENWFSSVKDNL